MSNQISRRVFLKCTGTCAAALCAAGLLAGCQVGSHPVEVKVGDRISNWNNLMIHLSSLFRMGPAEQEGYEYVAVLVLVQNLSRTESYAVGAQDILEIDAAYPVPPVSNIGNYFQALADSTTDFAVTCDGKPAESGAYIYLYDEAADSFSDSPTLPPMRAGYIELMCKVPTGWDALEVAYTPTFANRKTITFTMKSSELTAIGS